MAFSEANPAHRLLFWAPLVTAGLTALYMVRFWALTFLGPAGSATDGVKESPAVMLGPIGLLAGLAAFCAVGGDGGPLYEFLTASAPEPTVHAAFVSPAEVAVAEAHHTAETLGLIAAGVGTALAIGLFWVGAFRATTGARAAQRFVRHGLGFDALYRTAVVRPALASGTAAATADRRLLDGLVHGAAGLAGLVSRAERAVDEQIVDGLVRGVGRAARGGGRLFGAAQSGGLRQYVAALAACAVGLGVLAVVLLAG